MVFPSRAPAHVGAFPRKNAMKQPTKKRKKTVHIWDKCMRLMKPYTDRNPAIREIKDGACWSTFKFPDGASVHFRAVRRTSESALCILKNSNGGLDLAMDIYSDEDIDTARRRIKHLINT